MAIMPSSHKLLKYLRLIHLYTGVFIAPALLFFAFTGALQTFSLHETTRGTSYKPPAWVVMLGQIHKKQTPVVPGTKLPSRNKPADKAVPEKPSSPPAAESLPVPNTARKSSDAIPKPHNSLPLKCFFLLVSIGLFASTLSGFYMSCKYVRNRLLIMAILLTGIIVPVLLTVL
jgi:hypothetical protein